MVLHVRVLSGCQGGTNIDDVIACVRMPFDEIVIIDGFNLPLPSLYASVWDWVRSGSQHHQVVQQ